MSVRYINGYVEINYVRAAQVILCAGFNERDLKEKIFEAVPDCDCEEGYELGYHRGMEEGAEDEVNKIDRALDRMVEKEVITRELAEEILEAIS